MRQPSDQEIAQIIIRAEHALADTRARRESQGFGGSAAEARAQLEHLLSAEDIAAVEAEVQAYLQTTTVNAQALPGSTSTASAKSRRSTRMI